MLKTIGISVQLPIIVNEDNKGAIYISKTPTAQKRTRHIDIRYHFIRDHQDAGLIKVVECPTIDMEADMLTKNLPRPEFERQRNRVMSKCPKPRE